MENAITAITTNVTPTALWGQVETIMPFVATIIVFGFGFGIVKSILNQRKIRKGKM